MRREKVRIGIEYESFVCAMVVTGGWWEHGGVRGGGLVDVEVGNCQDWSKMVKGYRG